MYKTCLFCNQDLGTNEVVEALPIGRRVAFDAGKGRLWVVCTKCERWNLTPFDSRLEAIDDCERRFRSTKLRVSTDNIGLARVSEGLELVRIGEPLRPEMAAWRYGDQFGRRRRRHALVAGGAVAGVGAIVAGLAVAGVAVASFGGVYGQIYKRVIDRVHRVRIPAADGRIVTLVPSNARKARIWHDEAAGEIAISVRASGKVERWYGDDAQVIAGTILPRANIAGAGKEDVQRAVELITASALADDPLQAMLGSNRAARGTPLKLQSVSKAHRLALEMALHEEHERRALQGELAELEQRWRAAEEIAAIADSLTLPDSVEERFKNIKSGLPE